MQTINKTIIEPLGYFGIQRIEEYKVLYGNFVVRDCLVTGKKHKLEIVGDSILMEFKGDGNGNNNNNTTNNNKKKQSNNNHNV